jgi:peptide-methionine (S)-S-oxide reductase
MRAVVISLQECNENQSNQLAATRSVFANTSISSQRVTHSYCDCKAAKQQRDMTHQDDPGKSNPRSLCTITTTDLTTSSDRAVFGDIVTIDLDLRPENDFVPENLFDTSGRISLVLGWGNYLPALHELIEDMAVGEIQEKVSIDAGFGERRDDLLIQVPKSNLKKIQRIDNIVVGASLNLERGIQVQVVHVDRDSIVVDANHPLAGSSYACSLKVVSIDKMPTHKMEYLRVPDVAKESLSSESLSPFEIASFAMGCFWGIELAMMRVPGVVGTRAGYTQGTRANPSYQEVCQGRTKHREGVMVVYDSRVVSYQDILNVYADRLAATESQYTMNLFQDGDEDEESFQYKNGVYFHNANQRRQAQAFVDDNLHRYNVEILKATAFYYAEESHQQYLYKGGQASRKNARDTIRCFG